MVNKHSPVTIRPAHLDDLAALNELEQASFAFDRLSKRRLKHWIQADNGIFLIAEQAGKLAGYTLTLLHRGTRLARLYSIAVAKKSQGQGVGKALLTHAEAAAAKRGRLFLRLEVAQDNKAAIALYEQLGYQAFGTYSDYYEDHKDALRMQKRIRYVPENLKTHPVPWYQQTTEFSCGPAALMMAMAALNKKSPLNQAEELDLWREATTIYMTSGHGGCHPIGLALAAQRRGFKARAYINSQQPLFMDGVRNSEKKQILSVVHNHFVSQAKQHRVPVKYQDISQTQIDRWLHQGAMVIMLISTYRMDYKKAPHWVTITAMDDECLYVHDPDPTDGEQSSLDCQYLPIARKDFDKMSVFGNSKLRTAVVVERER